MIIDKQTFKEFRKEGGGLFNDKQTTANLFSSCEEIKDNQPCNVYIVPKGVLIDIALGKKICIYYSDIQDISNEQFKIIISANGEITKLVINNVKKQNMIYNLIAEKCGIKPQNMEVKNTKELKKEKKEYVKEHICEFKNVSGLPVIQGINVKIEKLDDKIEITTGNYVQEIKYSDIINISTKIFTEEKVKNKSVVGRAIVGGVLTGGIGALVGGMSGVGQKKQVNKKHGFELDYLKNGGQMCIELETKPFAINSNNFMKSILDKANATPKENVDGSSSADIADQLKKLADLKEQGIITEEEFQKGKEKILG